MGDLRRFDRLDVRDGTGLGWAWGIVVDPSVDGDGLFPCVKDGVLDGSRLRRLAFETLARWLDASPGSSSSGIAGSGNLPSVSSSSADELLCGEEPLVLLRLDLLVAAGSG